MPRYDESPRGHSPLDRSRDVSRRLKSPLLDRRRRDSPPLPPPPLPRSRDHIPMYHQHDDGYIQPLRSSHHSRQNSSSDLTTTTYKILCVSNISNKYPDSTVRNELIKEFARFGNPSVKLVYDKNTRIAYIYFNSYEDARDARHSKYRLILFEKQIIIDPIYDRVSTPRRRSLTPEYGRSSMRHMSPPMQRRPPPPPPPQRNTMNQDRYQLSHSSRDPYRDNYNQQMNNRNNDYHHSNSMNMRGQQHHHQQQQNQQQRESKKEKFPNYLHHIPPEEDDKSTRTLFVGNLEVTITEPDLRRIFERYGVVEDVDVKRPPPGQGNAYAFIKFLNLDMAHRAKVEMSGQYIGKFQCKIGYGKATPTTRIWIGGLGPWITFGQLDKEFDRFGVIRKIDYVKGENYAYIQFDTIDAAQAACAAMRGYPLGGPDKRLRIDYADPGPFSTSPRPSNEQGSFGFNNSPRSTSNNNGNNFEYWSNNQDSNAPSPKRRRVLSPDSENDRKKSPNNNSGLDSIVSPHAGGGAREGSPNFEISNGKSDIKVTIMESVTSVSELIKCCPPTWAGGLILKSSGFALRMYFCSGDIQLVDLMKETTTSTTDQQAQPQSILRITQRLRLESTKLEEVTKRISSSTNNGVSGNNPSGHCILIASQANNLQLNFNSCAVGAGASGSGGEDNAGGNTSANIQQRPIRNLVTYLKSKDAAGVVILPGKSSTQPQTTSSTTTATSSSTPGGEQTNETSKNVLYLFPPHPFSLELIQRIAPNISENSANKEDYFVVVLVRGSN
ncbi:rna-binding protein 15b-like protein [Dermatophagoides farinae]|uniref:Rna-binding protein 15b-like protein n=1 Tax=Dermatophagoides farinae TaxID=6954 RepID=A0A9D4P9B2_DERFA|nr:RNA-binding protein spenito-like [Dermatophagoides farinae]KAH7646317.1 rna-binding protein 15b-like protein [Dermatophagoides farinae]